MTALVVVRTLHFWAVAVMFGGAGFLLVLGRRPGATLVWLRAGSAVAAVTGAGWFVLVFTGIAGGVASLGDPNAWAAFAGAPFGPPWLVRLALCGAALAAAALRSPLPFLLIGTTLVIDGAWLGHAATGSALDLVVYWLHVGTALAWAGALVMLCVVASAEGRLPRDGLALFAWLGVPLVLTLVGAALFEAGLRGVTPWDLVATNYGRIIVAKTCLLAAMLALALFHRGRIRSPTAAMRLTLPFEATLGLAVLTLAAALGVTPPP